MRQYLIELRKLNGYSQQNVAELLGISPQYYQLIETGKRQKKLELSLASKLSSIFDLSIEKIYKEEKKL